MLSQFWPKLVVACFSLILCVAVVEAWRADRSDRAQLAAELAATKQLLTAADARQRDRDAELAQTLSALEAQKRAIVTPAQVLRALPKTLPLPERITPQGAPASSVEAAPGPPPANASKEPSVGARLASPAAPSAPSDATTPRSNQNVPAQGAFIPAADLKPLYDFTVDCQACQAKLSAAQNDLTDEKAKTAALTKERDDALRVAKGGSAWRRLTRAAKWFLLGAAAGAIAARAH